MKIGFAGVLLGVAIWAGGAAAQPAPAELKPGLSAIFMHGDYRNVDAMPLTPAALANTAKKRAVVPLLDEIGPEGEILAAGRTELYGIHLTGFLKLPAGETILVLNSNDGVRLSVNGKVVIDDPDIHADRMSLPAKVRQSQAGWVPIVLQYFQRRNTAALQLFWQKPGATEMEIVPAEAFGHVPAK